MNYCAEADLLITHLKIHYKIDSIIDFDLVKEFALSVFPTEIPIDPEGKNLKRFVG